MDREEFLKLDVEACAALVREHGKKTCVFWVNGTRRWYLLEHRAQLSSGQVEDYAAAYAEACAEQLTRCLHLLYSHGIDTVIIPALVPLNMLRGNEYMDDYLLGFVEQMVNNSRFRSVIQHHRIRGFGYGEMEEMLTEGQRDRFVRAKETATGWTAGHDGGRVFFGFCAADSANAALIALKRIGNERDPLTLTRADLVHAYYGDVIDRVHFSIAHGRMSAHSTPFMMAGEDLYFMVSPSFYFDETILKAILYDHLYERRINDLDYELLTEHNWAELRELYRSSRHQVLGLGRQNISGKVWTPIGAA